jgi:twitching motility protein PilT
MSLIVEDAVRPAADVTELLLRAAELGASDLHLSAGVPPTVRVRGDLRPLAEHGDLDADDVRRLVYGQLDADQVATYERDLELDVAFSLPGHTRVRMNVFRQRGSVGAALRLIPSEIPPFASLGLPPVVRTFAALPRGLVLVTGPTGSGKSTTLAALIDAINRTKPVHIVSCEDPIEFLHQHRRAVVHQREVGSDTHSFPAALKRVLRQDPDVILVGELRDLETISMALTAAETGHLVFGTLHTQSAHQTIDRLVDAFPAGQQAQVRVMLATTLRAVVAQQLLPTADGRGRVVAAEVLVATPAVANLIREAKAHQLTTVMQSGSRHGMVTMDHSLATLVKAGRIDAEVALDRAVDPADLSGLLSRSTAGRAAR